MKWIAALRIPGMALVLAWLGVGCDLVTNGGMIVVGDGGSVAGSLGNSQRRSRFAIDAQNRGSVTVLDATVIGGGFLVDVPEPTGQASQAIFGISASIRVVKGLVSGGSVIYTTGLKPSARPAPAISGISTVIDVSGGTLIGGGDATPAPLEAIGPPFGGPGVGTARQAVELANGTLNVSGGVFLPGDRGPNPSDLVAAAVQLFNSHMNVSGGQFLGAVALNGSRAVISGGDFGLLSFPTFSSRELLFGSTNNCSEIRGGRFDRVVVGGLQNVLVFGTGFNFPPGTLDVPATNIAFVPGSLLTSTTPRTGLPAAADPSTLPFVTLTGTFADGSPIDIDLTLATGATVRLLEPGSPGCS